MADPKIAFSKLRPLHLAVAHYLYIASRMFRMARPRYIALPLSL